MLKVENITADEQKQIGTAIGEAFAAEKDGLARLIPEADLIKAFEIMTEYYYRAGVLYTTSENQEGFLAYWFKHTKMPVKPACHMVWRLIKELPLSSVMKMAGAAGELYAKLYEKEPDYVAVSMIVVLKHFQGQGFMHKVLEEPFRIARQRKIPCVLDTDTDLKVQKYIRCGMKKTGQKQLKGGVCLYTMEYR